MDTCSKSSRKLLVRRGTDQSATEKPERGRSVVAQVAYIALGCSALYKARKICSQLLYVSLRKYFHVTTVQLYPAYYAAHMLTPSKVCTKLSACLASPTTTIMPNHHAITIIFTCGNHLSRHALRDFTCPMWVNWHIMACRMRTYPTGTSSTAISLYRRYYSTGTCQPKYCQSCPTKLPDLQLRSTAQLLLLWGLSPIQSALMEVEDRNNSRQREQGAVLWLDLCHFKNHKLEKQCMPLGDTDYIAVSHVWGRETELEWRSVPGIEDKVFATKRKVEFLTKQLPSVIEESYFWMDILCVDQRNEDARIAVTSHIPTIFRYAKQTIVVKDGVGTKDCCGQAAGDVSLDSPWFSALLRHCACRHAGSGRFNEAVLTRLWPFQEIILSDDLRFVHCPAPVLPESANRDTPTAQDIVSFGPVFSDLQNLAESWSHYGHDGEFDRTEAAKFIQAFLRHGKVSRAGIPGGRVRSHILGALGAAKDSRRKTTKTRDFVLAVMPEFHWYTVPDNAKQTTFGELLLDCFHQAERSDISFSPLVTVGWKTTLGDIQAVPPMTSNVPTPTTLGEFIRLILGPPSPILQETRNDNAALGRLRSYPIKVSPVIGVGIDRKLAIRLLHSTMRYSNEWWSRAWSGEMRDYKPNNFEIGEDLKVLPTCGDPDGVLPRAAAVVLKLLYTRVKFPLMRQHWTPEDATNWDRLRNWLIEGSSYDFIESLLRLAALISCGLGIGAYEWSIQNLTPLCTEFREKQLLVLSSNLGPRYLDECEFHLIKTEKADEYERFSFVAICLGAVPSYSIGLFPGDVFSYED